LPLSRTMSMSCSQSPAPEQASRKSASESASLSTAHPGSPSTGGSKSAAVNRTGEPQQALTWVDVAQLTMRKLLRPHL
jgi:hypothetical protein